MAHGLPVKPVMKSFSSV